MVWESQSRRRSELPTDWETTYRKPTMRRAKGLCELRLPGCTHRATDVHHTGDRNDHSLDKLQAACSSCHKQETAKQGVTARITKKRSGLRPQERHPGQL
jgi:hypothetical protein